MPTAPGAGWDVPTILVAVAMLSLIATAHLTLRWWIRRQTAAPTGATGTEWPAESRVRGWLTSGLNEMLPPLATLIWIHGISSTIGLLIGRISSPPIADQAFVALRWGYGVSVVLGIFWLLMRLGRILESFLISLAARAETAWDDAVLPLAGKVIRWTLPLLALILGAPALSVSPALAEVVGNATSLLLIGVVAFVLFQVVEAAAAVALKPQRLDVSDNLRARAIQTQVIVLKKVAMTAIGVFTLASMLMVFDSVRQFGASILASAGIAGIVVGFAAQRSIATLLAGFQIALTQPIRMDDVIIVDGEWGRVEDITLTYVVMRIWDQRALIVPITHFIEQPFQNWTRATADIIGTVFLHVDYTVPIEPLRRELTRILTASRHWDGRVNALQVTDAKEQTLELRALASAANASDAWDLRCEVREQLVAFVQHHHPDSLPRLRGSFETQAREGSAGHLTARAGAKAG